MNILSSKVFMEVWIVPSSWIKVIAGFIFEWLKIAANWSTVVLIYILHDIGCIGWYSTNALDFYSGCLVQIVARTPGIWTLIPLCKCQGSTLIVTWLLVSTSSPISHYPTIQFCKHWCHHKITQRINQLKRSWSPLLLPVTFKLHKGFLFISLYNRFSYIPLSEMFLTHWLMTE
jgi:hypothetical protein